MKKSIRFALAAWAFCSAVPASAAAVCTTCSVGTLHSYITTLARSDPNHIVTFADQRAADADPTLRVSTAMGTSSAAAGVGVLKAASQFTGSVADMPLYQRDDQIRTTALFRDQLTFAGNGSDLVDVNVNLPFDYILGSGNPNVRAIRVGVQFTNTTGTFSVAQRHRVQSVIDGTAGAVVVQEGSFFAPLFSFDVYASAGGAFAVPINHTFRLHANTPYNMSIYLEIAATNGRSTRLADASHTLNVGAFTGTFTDVTSTNYSLPGGGYSLPAVPEPSTWAMMIVGFGVIGLAAGQRRRQVQLLA